MMAVAVQEQYDLDPVRGSTGRGIIRFQAFALHEFFQFLLCVKGAAQGRVGHLQTLSRYQTRKRHPQTIISQSVYRGFDNFSTALLVSACQTFKKLATLAKGSKPTCVVL